MAADRKLKVLLVGHACSPYRGTELAVTWNWAWQLSQEHQVWVLTHPQERRAIEHFLAEHPNPNLHFIWVTVPRRIDPWDPAGIRWLGVHYVLWQRIALRTARRLHRQVGFDLAHHVSWGSVSAPPLVSRLPIPVIWGPVGGGQVAPSAFKSCFGSEWKAEKARSARVWIASHRPALRKAVRQSALVLATNRETVGVLKRAGGRNVQLFLDSGLREDFLAPEPSRNENSSCITLFWAGTLGAIKCLPLAFDALNQVRDLPVRLFVAGKGPLRVEWEALAARMGLSDRVSFLGFVPHNEMPAHYRSADAFIFTSLRDSFGSQTLEAMGAGLPIITLNHQGVGAFVPHDAGIKVPVVNPNETASGLAQAIRAIATSPELRARLGKAAWEFAKSQTWPRRAELMQQWYQGVVRGTKPASEGAGLTLSSQHL